MIYTNNDYEQDKRIATHAFIKFFGKHYLRDELIHIATIKLWEVRLEHGLLKDYVPQAIQIAKRVMFNHIRNENRHCRYDCLFDEVYDGLQLIEMIPNGEPTQEQKTDCEVLKALLGTTPLFANKKAKQIILLWFKHYTKTEIAYKLDTSPQYAGQIIKKFREQAQEILGGAL